MRIGARRTLAVADATAKSPKRILAALRLGENPRVDGFEIGQSIGFLNKVGGRVRKRYYDLVLRVNEGRIFCEVKRWTRWPPGPDALKSAESQLRRDVVKALTALEQNAEELTDLRRLRWIMPGGEDGLAGKKAAIVAHFKEAIDTPSVRQALARSLRERGRRVTKSAIQELVEQAKNSLDEVITFVE